MDQALSILTQMGVNQTFFLMFGVVVVFFILLNFITLKPLTKILVERDDRIEGRKEKAHEYAEEAVKLETTLSAELKTAHREAAIEFGKIKAEALQKQSKLLSTSREEAQTKIEKVRQEVGATIQAELAKVASEIPAISAMVMDRILVERGHKSSTNKSTINSEA